MLFYLVKTYVFLHGKKWVKQNSPIQNKSNSLHALCIFTAQDDSKSTIF